MLNEIRYSIANKDKRNLRNTLKSILPPRFVSNCVFYKHHRRFINSKSPRLLDEKLLILKDGKFAGNQLVSDCADKVKVREYVRAKGFSEILVPQLGVYDDPDEIDLDSLPDKFVLKCNHGCGFNIIVTDKKNFDIDKAKEKLRDWMRLDYGVISSEHHYSGIERKIFAEDYIETEAGVFPNDYKFFCSYGTVICSLIISGRGGQSSAFM